LESTDAVAFSVGAQAILADWLGQDFDTTAQQIAQLVFELDQTEQIHPGRGIKLGGQVNGDWSMVMPLLQYSMAERRLFLRACTVDLRISRAVRQDRLFGEQADLSAATTCSEAARIAAAPATLRRGSSRRSRSGPFRSGW
jgi:hypothetical protein